MGFRWIINFWEVQGNAHTMMGRWNVWENIPANKQIFGDGKEKNKQMQMFTFHLVFYPMCYACIFFIMICMKIRFRNDKVFVGCSPLSDRFALLLKENQEIGIWYLIFRRKIDATVRKTEIGLRNSYDIRIVIMKAFDFDHICFASDYFVAIVCEMKFIFKISHSDNLPRQRSMKLIVCCFSVSPFTFYLCVCFWSNGQKSMVYRSLIK